MHSYIHCFAIVRLQSWAVAMTVATMGSCFMALQLLLVAFSIYMYCTVLCGTSVLALRLFNLLSCHRRPNMLSHCRCCVVARLALLIQYCWSISELICRIWIRIHFPAPDQYPEPTSNIDNKLSSEVKKVINIVAKSLDFCSLKTFIKPSNNF